MSLPAFTGHSFLICFPLALLRIPSLAQIKGKFYYYMGPVFIHTGKHKFQSKMIALFWGWLLLIMIVVI